MGWFIGRKDRRDRKIETLEGKLKALSTELRICKADKSKKEQALARLESENKGLRVKVSKLDMDLGRTEADLIEANENIQTLTRVKDGLILAINKLGKQGLAVDIEEIIKNS